MPFVKSISIHTGVYKALKYILNPDKTEDLLYTSSMNCMTDAYNAYLNMKANYEHHSGQKYDAPLPAKGKGAVKAIHYIQSFDPKDNVPPELAHRIAKAFARKTFGDDVQVVIATHVDKKHTHNHIIINSYSMSESDSTQTRNLYREYVNIQIVYLLHWESIRNARSKQIVMESLITSGSIKNRERLGRKKSEMTLMPKFR